MLGDGLQGRQIKVPRVLPIDIVQILLQQFSQNHEVLSVIEELVHVDDAGLIWIAVCFDVPQQLYFIEGLVEVVFVVEDHFQTKSLFLIVRG